MIEPLIGLLAPGQVRPGAPAACPASASRPGWSSADGGIEKFPELREISRSSRSSRAVLRLYKDLLDERGAWHQRIAATLFHQGMPAGIGSMCTAEGRAAVAEAGLSPAGRQAVETGLRSGPVTTVTLRSGCGGEPEPATVRARSMHGGRRTQQRSITRRMNHVVDPDSIGGRARTGGTARGRLWHGRGRAPGRDKAEASRRGANCYTHPEPIPIEAPRDAPPACDDAATGATGTAGDDAGAASAATAAQPNAWQRR
jgi:hypothetical protein